MAVGFIVARQDSTPPEIQESDIKDVAELIDDEPVVSPEMLELTRWMSDYYYASWGECLKAALPAGAADANETLMSVTDLGSAALAHPDDVKLTTPKYRVRQAISRSAATDPAQLDPHLPRVR